MGNRVLSPARPVVATVIVLLLVVSATAAGAQPGVPADDLPYVSTLRIADAALAADAGDSAYVQPGEHVVLHGTSFGGEEPYAYRWEIDAGTLQVHDSPTAVITTDGVDAGTYTATLTVTDGAGTVSTDTVVYQVAGTELGEPETLFGPETIQFHEPDLLDTVFGETRFAFDVPEGFGSITATMTWTIPTNDYDIHLVDPDGNVVASSGDFVPDDEESATASNPVPGEWEVWVERWLTHGEPEFTVWVDGRPAGEGDPRPDVDSGGPYSFVLGQDEQVLTGTASGEDIVELAWDLDLDGAFETAGDEVTADLPPGRHLVSFRATTVDGHRSREMTSVLVGTSQEEVDRLATPITTIGFADSGINPYHLEFSAAAYPDPELLELTRNFTRHPSEYIPGYPEDAEALPITLGEGYFPEQDAFIWDPDDRYIEPGRVYWIPGTKIVGAIDAGGYSGSIYPILDDNGHGTGSASVAAGNRYGYCPTCLIVAADALSAGTRIINTLDWVDISTNSWGTTGGAPLGVAGADQGAKRAAERGQTILFSAGNGMANTFFDVPILTWGSDFNGPDWVISVGAIREDNQGAIISDGVPVHVSNLGDGDLPSACRVGDSAQCAFGGTSAASPYTAGVFGTVLTEIRGALGDHSHAGQRDGQVVAEGTPVDSPFLEDGRLTRRELRAAVLKTSAPRYGAESEGRFYPLPQHWNLEQAHYVFEGYGSPGPAAAERAIEVLLGLAPLPDRGEEDEFFLRDCEVRDGNYGGYDRTGDGEEDDCSESEAVAFTGDGELTNDDPRDGSYDPARDAIAQDTVATEPLTYYLHRRPVHAPDDTAPADEPTESGGPCAETHNESFLSRTPAEDGENVDVCFDDRITSTVAAYRPKGIFAAKDVAGAPIPAGSQVDVTAYVRSHEPGATELVAVLKATDREIGRSEPVAQPTHPGDWTEFELSFETVRPVAAGEQLSFHFVHLGARAYAYGYGGDNASRFTITPGEQPDRGLEFGVAIDTPEPDTTVEDGDVLAVAGQVAFPDLGPDPQLAGFHPTSHAVQVAVDDPDFRDPVYAELDRGSGTFSAILRGLEDGERTLYVRALRDRYASDVVTVPITIGAEDDDDEVDEPGDRRGPPIEPPRGRPELPPGQAGPPGHGEGGPPGQQTSTTVLSTGSPASDHPGLVLVALAMLGLTATASTRTLVNGRTPRG